MYIYIRRACINSMAMTKDSKRLQGQEMGVSILTKCASSSL